MRAELCRAAVAVVLLTSIPEVYGQEVVSLPSTGVTTALTASVSEQATVTLPAGVTFNVTNVAVSTSAPKATISIQNIVTSSAAKQITISLMANAASFTPPVAGAVTWAAGDVSWTNPNGGADAWVNATRNNATLSSSAFTLAATCNQDTSFCSTTGFTFALAAKSTVGRSGAHTLVVTWKVETIGS